MVLKLKVISSDILMSLKPKNVYNFAGEYKNNIFCMKIGYQTETGKLLREKLRLGFFRDLYIVRYDANTFYIYIKVNGRLDSYEREQIQNPENENKRIWCVDYASQLYGYLEQKLI